MLGSDLPPREGLSVDIGAGYATLARRLDRIEDLFDVSDVTPKSALVGVGQAHAAAPGLGAGTPASEWRVQFALATSHDEQERNVVGETPVRGSGTGRYVNFGALGRYRVGLADSLEVGLERREHQITDFSQAAFVPPPPVFLYQRDMTARRLDAAAGWRHRWKGLEAAASVRYIVPFGRSENAETLSQSSGSLWGGAVEARWCRGGWTLAFAAERAAGTLNVDERSTAAGVDRLVQGDALLSSIRPSVTYRWGRTELFGAVGFERQNLPFVSLALIAAESAALQTGRHLDSELQEVFWDIRARRSFSSSFSALLAVRLGYGMETVTISDASGTELSKLQLRRRGIFGGGLSGQLGSPELTFFLGANFAVGSP